MTQVFTVLGGLALFIYGVQLMGQGLQKAAGDRMRRILGALTVSPLTGTLVGAFVTAIIQSSSATTGVLIVLAQQGLISLEGGIPVIFGANIGTCVTAALAGIGASREANRVAIAHIMFKFAGVILFIFWIPQFADLIRALAGKFGSGTARQLANAHTLFNVGLGLFFLPFILFKEISGSTSRKNI